MIKKKKNNQREHIEYLSVVFCAHVQEYDEKCLWQYHAKKRQGGR